MGREEGENKTKQENDGGVENQVCVLAVREFLVSHCAPNVSGDTSTSVRRLRHTDTAIRAAFPVRCD